MDENLKNRAFLVLGILNVIFLLLWISSCSDARKFRTMSKTEMETRLNSEQKVNELQKQKVSLEEKNNKSAKDLAQQKAELEAVRKSLTQEQLVAKSLKAELEKISKLKEALEEDLKDALVKGKSSGSDRFRK